MRGPSGAGFFAPDGLLVVVEILSPDPWRSDLGIGRADDVDKPRTYLAAGVREYWIVNAGVDARTCPLPPRSARFLQRVASGETWTEVEPRDGRYRCQAIPGLELDLERFWADCTTERGDR